ncbi:MAG: glycosyltransferase [Gammaproteobacteria bacterium]|nr:glycosyltransferase [Gammaproteobacteria bacterium]
MTDSIARPRVLVLASTFPRHEHDTLPDFVSQLCNALAGDFRITVLAPHAPGSRRVGRIGRCSVVRFRYAWPTSLQGLAYGNGILANLRQRPWSWLLLPGFLLAGMLATRRLARRVDAKLVHAHWLLPAGLTAALARPGRPLLLTCHGSDVLAGRSGLLSRLRRFTLARCTRVTAVSSSLGDAVRRLSPGSKPLVIPLGIDTQQFTPPAIDTERQGILFAGRLADAKGVGLLPGMLEQLHPDHPTAVLHIAGEGAQRAQLEKAFRRHGLQQHVAFHGWLPPDRLASIMRDCRILVFPSRDFEGFGLVLAEGMAAGCAVVASDLPTSRELIDDGENGLLVAPGDVDALSTAVARLLADPQLAARLGIEARQRIESGYSRASAVQSFAGLYRKLLAGDCS